MITVEHVTKQFPGALALDDVSLTVAAGSCHALIGENGAGKSTLGKIIAGIYQADAGVVRINGEPVNLRSPADATACGISMVHQELLFCENMTVAENLCLGDLPRKGIFLDRRKMMEKAREWLAAIGAQVGPEQLVGDLPVAKQQLVQIAGAVAKGARILIFDEPTSSLSRADAERLFELIRSLQTEGMTSIYVSHRLEEVFALCDTVTVLRDGKVVGTKPAKELTEDDLVRMMIGRELAAEYQQEVRAEAGKEVLLVEGLTSPGKFEDVSFTLREGEILGLAGLVGAGRTELAEALFGLDPRAGGKVLVHGAQVNLRHPRQAMRKGLGLVPEDRKRHGLVLSMTARDNISLPTMNRRAVFGWVRADAEKRLSQSYFEQMNVKAAGIDAPTASLSGGNQQKLVLAKWLAADCEVLIIDEPTRGVDIGAKAEIHALVRKLAESRKAVLLISSDMPELLNLATRIIVLREGRAVGEVSGTEATEEGLMRMMAGVVVTAS